MESRDLACRPEVSRGVPRNMEEFVELLAVTLEGLKSDWAGQLLASEQRREIEDRSPSKGSTLELGADP